jgi:transcriptional regulator GlxA family with amidase domain
MTRDVAVLAFDQMEVFDFARPIEVLTTCNRVAERGGVETPINVASVADTPRVRARAGIDMFLHQVERLASDELAQATARQLDFGWRR